MEIGDVLWKWKMELLEEVVKQVGKQVGKQVECMRVIVRYSGRESGGVRRLCGYYRISIW